MPSVDALQQALAPLQGRPIYLTVDLDWFDPAVLPGTGTPEPGGYLWSDFASLIGVLREHHLVAADVVELAPQLDTSGISSVLAAKVTRSLLLLLGGDQEVTGISSCRKRLCCLLSNCSTSVGCRWMSARKLERLRRNNETGVTAVASRL